MDVKASHMGAKERENADETPRTETQLIYARVMRWISSAGLILMVVVFGLYILGVLPVRIDVEQIARNWHTSSRVFIDRLDALTGWQWVASLGYGDALSLGTIVLLATTTPVCLIVAALVYARKRSWIYAAIAIVQTAVLVFAASGLAGGGH